LGKPREKLEIMAPDIMAPEMMAHESEANNKETVGNSWNLTDR